MKAKLFLLCYLGGKNIMLDCGMHMGFSDDRKFPDFSYIVPGNGGNAQVYFIPKEFCNTL